MQLHQFFYWIIHYLRLAVKRMICHCPRYRAIDNAFLNRTATHKAVSNVCTDPYPSMLGFLSQRQNLSY
jgi:hypothetical protein